ncbi:Cytochrome P450 [Pleurostoma richardsiae]|uniref:Cytochrome P450 n=1 Tax=Pleurostoma richardsiae TaxID=41990 RepID=A0AA38VY58_9PEZI|nr:Cytochrome P450 [Pleurostoma richardsiae]
MILLSPAVLGGCLLLGLAVYLLRCLTSPLRKVPGPAASLFTSLVLKWHEFHGRRTRYVHGLHQRYGPVVRIAPGEVSFSSGAAVKEIYCSGGSGYDKTEFYNLFQIYGRRTMFSTLNRDDHARRKRLLADRYANSNVLKQDSIHGIQERSENFVQRCRSSEGKSLDVYTSLHAFAFDCVSHHLFHPYGSNSLQSQHDEDIMLEVTGDSSLQNRLVKHHWPVLYNYMGKVLALFAAPRETPLADKFVQDASSQTDTMPFTLLSRLRDDKHDLEKLTIAAESLDHMAAGIDTTGDALCFLMWELSQPRSLHFQERLRAELRDNPEAQFDRLPFLDAVVNEGLRCFPAIPMSLPRYVPSGGRSIDGYFVPEHTVVSCQAYSVHRINESVFPDPDRFDPDRWLSREGDAERKRLFFAFANGGRGCVGKHLALAEMKILLRDVYSRYATLPDGSMRPEEMEMDDQLVSSRPLGQRCLLQFIPTNTSS